MTVQPSTIVSRTTITLPDDAPIVLGNQRSLAISRDGTRLAYRAFTDSGVHIFTRSLDERAFRQVPATREASDLFVSPDGQVPVGKPFTQSVLTGSGGPPAVVATPTAAHILPLCV